MLLPPQVYNRSGYTYTPEAIAHIPDSGIGVVDTHTGVWYASQTSYLTAMDIPRSYTLRYMDAPRIGVSLGEYRKGRDLREAAQKKEKEKEKELPISGSQSDSSQ